MKSHIFLLTFFLLAGCGGSDSPPPANNPPLANAGIDQIVDEKVVVTLNTSGTGGIIETYKWIQVEGVTVQLNDVNSVNSTFIAPTTIEQLNLTFKLIVTDNNSLTDSDTVRITVLPINEIPTVNASSDKIVSENTNILLEGISSDLDGYIVSSIWTQLTGEDITINDFTSLIANFNAPSLTSTMILTFNLAVTDNEGATNNDSVQITIQALDQLNDTGVVNCTDGTNNLLICPVVDYNGQDGELGRDARSLVGDLQKIGGGNAGFDFTKLDSNGLPLDYSAADWSCVKDNFTGFIWEVKKHNNLLQEKNNTYSWYNPDNNNNGGDVGTQNGGTCIGSNCDINDYLKVINNNELCGSNKWQLPSVSQLQSIIDYSQIYPVPTIDNNYFPNTINSNYWTLSPSAMNSSAFLLNFSTGGTYVSAKWGPNHVRLVLINK